MGSEMCIRDRGGALAAALPAGQLARGVGDGGGHAPLRVHVGVGVCQFPRLAPRRDRHAARHRHAVQGPRDLPELHAARAPARFGAIIAQLLRNSAHLPRNSPTRLRASQELDRVSEVLTAQHFTPGTVIIEQGTTGAHCYLLIAGEVEVILKRDGENQTLLTLSQLSLIHI